MPRHVPVPVIDISAAGAHVSLSPRRKSRLRASFRMKRIVKLPRVIAPALLPVLQERAASCAFRRQTDLPWDRREVADDLALTTMLSLLFRDLDVFQAVRDITGCSILRGLTVAVFRTAPGSGQVLDWHRDAGIGRAMAMTVNLSMNKFDGGALEIRRGRKGKLLGRMSYSRPGDALLFPVSRRLFHRSAPVTGRVHKTILSIWFHY